MKFAAVTKSLALGFALMLAASAFAATKDSLQISDAVTLNGTTLKPGEYKVEWEGSGSDVEVSIVQGKSVLAKAPGHPVELDARAPYDAAVTRKKDDGTSSLIGVRFGGKNVGLDFGESGNDMQDENQVSEGQRRAAVGSTR
jgi:hypothetical protein